MNIDTDTQYAFTRPIADHMFKNYSGILKIDGEIGDKKQYDPRTYLKIAEKGAAERLGQPLRWPDADRALLLYGNVLVIGGLASLLLWYGQKRRRVTAEPAAPEPAPTAAPRPALLDRLPPGFGPDIVALGMEDHYLRVHGAYGSELILLRMRDAVQEVAPLAGAQVHRSWWVARGAVRETHREGRGLRLVLTGGIEARVSRAMVPVLEAEGWW